MPVGKPLPPDQVDLIGRAIARANSETGLKFSVYLGESIDDASPREFAARAHRSLGEVAAHSVLMMVAPTSRRVEIVTGSDITSRVDDRACGLAALSMSSAFAGGDLAGGIVTGIRMLADKAGQPARPRLRVGR